VYYVLTAREERPAVPEQAKQPPAARPAPAPAPKAPAAAPARPLAQAPAPAAPQRTVAAPTKPAPAKAPAPAAPQKVAPPPAKAAAPAKTSPAPQGAKAAQPPVLAPGQKGLKTVPPFMAGATLDPSYGKGHPGWVRYLGARAQYRLYREGGTFRALQIIPVGGQSIPDQLYQRALLEFGGIDSYQIQSSDTKGKYLVEQGVAKGGVAVTLYRDKRDLSLRGLVVYYR
jgi:hypothetical protein